MQYLFKAKSIGLILAYVLMSFIWYSMDKALFGIWAVVSGFFIAFKLLATTKEGREKFKTWLDT